MASHHWPLAVAGIVHGMHVRAQKDKAHALQSKQRFWNSVTPPFADTSIRDSCSDAACLPSLLSAFPTLLQVALHVAKRPAGTARTESTKQTVSQTVLCCGHS